MKNRTSTKRYEKMIKMEEQAGAKERNKERKKEEESEEYKTSMKCDESSSRKRTCVE